MIKAIIFDYDGVIVDSFANVHQVYQIMCKHAGVSCPSSLEEFRKTYGHSFQTAYKNLRISEDKIDEVNEIFRKEILKKNPHLFKGIKTLIPKLSKDYLLFIATANHLEEAEQKLSKFGLSKFFNDILSSKTLETKKHELITKIMNTNNLKEKEIIYIGDRNVDYDVAKNAGLKHILLVEYGWGYQREYCKGIEHEKVNKPMDILKAINHINKTL